MKIRLVGWAFASALVFLGMAAQTAHAQSTIFNIPSTDTVSPGKGYFEFDYLPQLPKADFSAWQVFAPRGIVGVTPQLEVGANVAFTHVSDGGGTTTIVQPNAKYRFYADDDKGIAGIEVRFGEAPITDEASFMRAQPALAASRESQELVIPSTTPGTAVLMTAVWVRPPALPVTVME